MNFQNIQIFRPNIRTLAATLWLALCLLGGMAHAAPTYLSSEAQKIADYMANESGQQRPYLTPDPILTQVAQARAADMAARGYFAHVNPDGVGPNYLVRQAGYPLPAWWGTSSTANYIESISAGYSTSSAAWQAWMNSSAHRTHLLGTDSDGFYAAQTSYGIGVVQDPNSRYQYYWVVITAPPPPLVILTPNKKSVFLTTDITATGTADASAGTANVQWRLENSAGIGAYQLAIGVENWSAALVGVTAGTNTLRVRSVDGSGSVIFETTRSFTYSLPVELTVAVVGTGSVTSGFEGTTTRAVGVSYSITATPATGYVFAGWTGDITSSSTTVSFTLQDNLSVTANFVIKPAKKKRRR